MKKTFFALLGAALFGACLSFGACSTGEAAAAAAAKMLGGSSQALLFINCKAVSQDMIEFEFSQPVSVKSLDFDPALNVASVENGKIVKVYLGEIPEPGLQFTADLLAEDADKNSINVLVPFRSRNNRMPSMVINEICTESASTTKGKKFEFIEFKMKSAGNLGAIRVFIRGNTNAGRETIYEFLPAEVNEGEYVVLHLRNADENCKDEYGKNLNESGGLDASPAARDIWLPDNTKLIHKEASAVYALDQDDCVLAAVMISSGTDSWWSKDYLAETADFLFKQGAWKSADGKICRPADSVNSSGTTNTRTICRDETAPNSNSAADWYITDTSCATPGGKNNEKRYVPK